MSNCELVTNAWHVNSRVMYCLVYVYAGMFNVMSGAIVCILDCCELAPWIVTGVVRRWIVRLSCFASVCEIILTWLPSSNNICTG